MGSTALIYAATFNHLEIAKLLLANGADKTVKDARGHNAADHAKMQGYVPMANLVEHA